MLVVGQPTCQHRLAGMSHRLVSLINAVRWRGRQRSLGGGWRGRSVFVEDSRASLAGVAGLDGVGGVGDDAGGGEQDGNGRIEAFELLLAAGDEGDAFDLG